jgi:hypothetical protein
MDRKRRPATSVVEIQKLPLHLDRDACQQTHRSPSQPLSDQARWKNFLSFFLPVFAVTASALPCPAAKWLLKLSRLHGPSCSPL